MGKQQVAEVFVDGKSHGVRLKWHRNGQKTAEDSIVKGELNGPCYKWHDNGQLAEEMVMVDGHWQMVRRDLGIQDGSQKAQVTLEMGKVIEQKFWEEAEKPGEDFGPGQKVVMNRIPSKDVLRSGFWGRWVTALILVILCQEVAAMQIFVKTLTGKTITLGRRAI